jgi:hypothetical protein
MAASHRSWKDAMAQAPFQRGDRVVYRLSKHSTMPGPRAKDIVPADHGDDYSYQVDKYWIVLQMPDTGHVLLKTRRGKEHLVDLGDPNLRRANWLEKLFYGHRFPKLESTNDHQPS